MLKKDNMKNKDEGSLTAVEYEFIYDILNEYCRIIPLIKEEDYIKDVRVSHRKGLVQIIKKMKRRMEIEYPNPWV